MNKKLPLFPVTTVGSWPRSHELLRLQKMKRLGKIKPEEFDKEADKEVLEILNLQEEAGIDIVTDGEQRRDNFFSFVAEKISGVKLMTLAEMLDVVEDKAGFEQILQTLDVPSYSLSNPCCVGKIKRRSPLAVDDLKFLKAHTDKAIKITLPGPYLLTRSMWVPELTKGHYSSKEELARDVIEILREEIAELIETGVDFIQFDEPVLTEVAFAQGNTRTFMCAALAARKDPREELEFAVSLINAVLEGFKGPIFGLHICRGNWSQNESILLSGDYFPLSGYLERLQVNQLVLEYATERAGDIMSFGGKSLGLGVVNPRQEIVEDENIIMGSINKALQFYTPDKLFLNPDCGFGTFSNSPVNSREIARKKLETMVAAAKKLRKIHNQSITKPNNHDKPMEIG